MAISMNELRTALTIGPEIKQLQAEATIKSKVIDEAIILADDPEIRYIATKAKAYEIHGVRPETVASLLMAEAMHNGMTSVIKSIAE